MAQRQNGAGVQCFWGQLGPGSVPEVLQKYAAFHFRVTSEPLPSPAPSLLKHFRHVSEVLQKWSRAPAHRPIAGPAHTAKISNTTTSTGESVLRARAAPGVHLRRDAPRTPLRPGDASNLTMLVERHFRLLLRGSEAKVRPLGLRWGQIGLPAPVRRDSDDGHSISVSDAASQKRGVGPLPDRGLSGARSPRGPALGWAGTMPNCTLGVERHFRVLRRGSEAKVGSQGLRRSQIPLRAPSRQDGGDDHSIMVSGVASPQRGVGLLPGCGRSGDRSPWGPALGWAGAMSNCTLGVERHFRVAGKRNCGRWGVHLSQVYVVSRREARVTDLTTQAQRAQSASATAGPPRQGRWPTGPVVACCRTDENTVGPDVEVGRLFPTDEPADEAMDDASLFWPRVGVQWRREP